MLTLWVFFRHPCWHIVNIVVICQENWTWKIFLPLTDTWLFFLQFHCSTAPWSTLTENKKKRQGELRGTRKNLQLMGAPGTASCSFHLPAISTAVHSGDIAASPPFPNLLVPSHYSELHWRFFILAQIFFCLEAFSYALLDVLSTSACLSWRSDFILITIFVSL